MHPSHQHRKLTDVPKPQHPPEHTLVPSEPNLLVFISSVMTPELNWARNVAVRAVNSFRCAQPWAFEFTPASSESATDAYLRKAGEADFLVWLVGSQTTQPVVDEVTARMAAGRRLLVFKLPAESRDTATEKLLAMVSKHCKWQDISTGTALGEALTASLSDEIRRALRDPAAPARRQTLRQWRDSSLAMCKQLWITLGVPSALATELANDRSVGDILTPTDVHFQMAVAAAGSGKSLGASRFFQRAIDAALKDGTQPFPLFVNARDLTHPLEEYIERRTAGLVQPHSQPTLVIIDGLDERGVSQANALLTQIRYYVDAYPESRFLATSRPLPGLRLHESHTTLPALSDHETIDLISRIAERTVQLVELYGWSESIRNAAHRPLFAVMIGADLRQGRSMGLDRPADLINRLARHVVDQNRQQGEQLNRLLQKLAVKAISTGRRVRRSDVSLSHADQRLLANSGLIDESGVTFDFNHEVLREWYAARALIEENVSIDEVVPASDRWMTVFQLVLESENENARDTLRYTLARSDPGLAALLISDTTRGVSDSEVTHSPPESAEQVGSTLWNAMDAWRRGLGALFQEIGPVAVNGKTSTLGIRMDSTRVTISWYSGRSTLPRPVVPLPDSLETSLWDLDPGWAVLHTELFPLGAEWAWRRTKSDLVDSLSKKIMTRRLALPSDYATRELVWAFALAVTRQGEFSPTPIGAREVLEAVQRMAVQARRGVIVFKMDQLEIAPFELDLIKGKLECLLQHGQNVVRDPWPGFDRSPSSGARRLHTWDFYSDERLLQRATTVYTAALGLYMDMVNKWFDGFRHRLRFARLFPISLEGRLAKSQQPDWEGAPRLIWRARALPHDETSRVALEWSASEEFDLLAYWREEEESLKTVRSGTDATPFRIAGDSLSAINTTRPVTDLAHTWLIRDLEELSWTDLGTVSLL